MTIDIDFMTQGFLTCVLWAESGDPDSPLGVAPSPDDLANETRTKAHELCTDFTAYCERVGIDLEAVPSMDAGSIGHDFWLTMQGHGAGFWDRGLRELGDRLTEAAKTFSADCYLGDDGKVYLQ